MSFKVCRLCLTLCLCLTATAVSAAPFTSPRGYSLDVPTGWHAQTHIASGDDAHIVVNQPVMLAHRMTLAMLQVQVRPVDSQMTWANMGAYNRVFLSAIRQQFPDLKVLSLTSLALGGTRDLDCIFTATVNGVPARFHSVMVLRHLAVATFTCVCPDQLRTGYDPIFAKMLASVRWKS